MVATPVRSVNFLVSGPASSGRKAALLEERKELEGRRENRVGAIARGVLTE
jgi:hypothetical protein